MFDVELRAPRLVRWVLATLCLTASCNDAGVTTAIPFDSASADLRASIASVTVDPATVSATAGDSGAFTATARDRYGSAISGAVFTWKSSDTTVVRVRANGFAVALQGGSVTI
ncbi:MAG TPA: hypothetical protein VF483_02580, partial [Gemmatimonadaceae bacterium]